jgi:hypothetical protein
VLSRCHHCYGCITHCEALCSRKSGIPCAEAGAKAYQGIVSGGPAAAHRYRAVPAVQFGTGAMMHTVAFQCSLCDEIEHCSPWTFSTPMHHRCVSLRCKRRLPRGTRAGALRTWLMHRRLMHQLLLLTWMFGCVRPISDVVQWIGALQHCADASALICGSKLRMVL